MEIPQKAKNKDPWKFGAIELSYPPRVRVRATVKLSATFFHDESSITIIGKYKRAIALEIPHYFFIFSCCSWSPLAGNPTFFLINPWKFHMIFL